MLPERPHANPSAPTAPAAPPAALPPAFVEEVRAALDHLYDSTFLHNHPLGWRLCADPPTGGVTRAQRVRTLLLDAIEQLRPEPRFSTDEMRAYAILTYRCLDGMSMDEIAAKLGLSRRQAYREYAKGAEAVAGIVWDALPPTMAPGAPPADAQHAMAQPGAAPTPAAPVPQAAGDLPAPGEDTRLNAAAQEVARLAGNLFLEAVDLPAVAANAAESLAPRTQHTGVQMRIEASAALPAVAADRALLRQALLNLFSYALDQACRSGKVTVTWVLAGHNGSSAAGLRLAACAGRTVPAEFSGPGADPPARREGIGISVAQQLIEAMGGRAAIEQAADEWRCTLLLPVAPQATVLVVDDNADLTALFQRYTAGQLLNVVGVTSGAQALAQAGELRPQIIFLDLMLSHMDGWEILQRLRAEAATQRTPIVICSVLNERDLAFSLGASDYVTKPISQATLIDVLRRWLGKQHPPA